MGDQTNEEKAIRECRSGRIQGLQVLYELYKDQVFRTCFRILGSSGVAEDATQEVFIRVYEQLSRSKFDGRSAFSTWLYRLSVNYALNLLRREKSGATLSAEGSITLKQLPVASPAPDENLSQQRERSGEIQAVLSTLTSEHRTVLVLREIEGLSYKEISDVLGIPIGTVMSRISRAREEFKARWLEIHDDKGE